MDEVWVVVMVMMMMVPRDGLIGLLVFALDLGGCRCEEVDVKWVVG